MVNNLMATLGAFAFRILTAAILLAAGIWLARLIKDLLQRTLVRRRTDLLVVQFLSRLTYWTLITLVVLAALLQAGVSGFSYLVGLIAAAGLAVGLALQGTLSNFAAGVMILILRPFSRGDYIEGAGTGGSVEDVQFFITTLKTPDNRLVYVPNAQLTGGHIVNYSREATRRIDLTIGVGYGDDLKKARATITDVLAGESRVLPDPAPVVAVGELADSSVQMIVRPWVAAADYWPVYWDLLEKIKTRFDQEGLTIPYPQRDVHVYEREKPKKH